MISALQLVLFAGTMKVGQAVYFGQLTGLAQDQQFVRRSSCEVAVSTVLMATARRDLELKNVQGTACKLRKSLFRALCIESLFKR